MSNVYYGICSSARDATPKEVDLLPIADIGSISELQVGDLLAIYFEKGNTAPSVTIKLRQDLEVDEGLTIKTLGVEEDCAYIWQDGEAVIFVCTSINENTEVNTNEQGADPNPQDEAYVSIVDCGKATSEFYGVTKLLTSEQTGDDIGDYLDNLDEDAPEWDYTITTSLLKKLYDLIGAQVVVSYSNAIPEDDENVLLGTLSVNNTQYQVLTPPQTIYTYTSQLENNGDGHPQTVRRGNVDETRANQYIKNVLGVPLYFTGAQPTVPTTDGIPVYLYTQTENADYPIIGNDIVSSGGTTTSTTKVFGDTIQLGNSVIVNNDSQSPTISLPATSIDGNTNITGGLTVSSDISEAGTLLKNKYSGKLIVTTHTLTLDTTNNTKQITVAKNSLSNHKFPVVNLSDRVETLLGPVETGANYQCLGIVGHNYDYYDSDSKVDSSYVSEWELFPSSLGINTATIGFDIRNLNTQKSIVFTLRVNLLWVKIVN